MSIPQADFIQRLLDQNFSDVQANKLYSKLWSLLVDARANQMKKTKKDIQVKLKKEIKEQDEKNPKLKMDDV